MSCELKQQNPHVNIYLIQKNIMTQLSKLHLKQAQTLPGHNESHLHATM